MKKVLASVLAGTMVLSMAAMASAAPTIGLERATGENREFDLPLYQPRGTHATVDPDDADIELDWMLGTQDAFDEFEAEFRDFRTAARRFDDLRDYFEQRRLSGDDTIVDAYRTFVAAVRNDANCNALVTGFGARWIGPGATYDQAALALITAPITRGTTGYDDTSLGGMMGIYLGSGNNDRSPEQFLRDAIATGLATRNTDNIVGNGTYQFDNKTSWDISDEDVTPDFIHMYTYGEDHVKEVRVNVWVAHNDSLRADVNEGKVTVSKKLVQKNWVDANNRSTDADLYMLTIKANAGVRDFELDDFTIELDVGNDDHDIYFLKGDVAYSDYREVLPGDRLTIKKSNFDDEHNDGCVFKFSEPIDEKVRIICEEDYVDLYFDGNYGTDFENLLVMTNDITEVEDYFQDYDIDYYDFIGTPKFARDVKCIIDADADSYIYEYDKKTGDVVDITDSCEYTSNGWEFSRKSFKTYVILEEPYEGGNVKAEKEPVAEEPEDEPEDKDEPKDDTANEGSKPNPGTGAYPLF